MKKVLREIWFDVCLVLGTYGMFRYQGLHGMEPQWWPRAHVLYPDGKYSVSMPIGNAIEYASMFDGEVVPMAMIEAAESVWGGNADYTD